MKKIILSLALAIGLLAFTQPANAVITYTVTSGASGSLTSSGEIFDGLTLVGTWTSTISGQTTPAANLGDFPLSALSASVVTASTTTINSAPLLGIAIRMTPFTIDPSPGVANYTLTYSATITNANYSLISSYISGRTVPGPGNFGPVILNNGALAAGNTNVLTFSGFSGNATLTEGAAGNLVQNTGATFASGGTLNWAQGPNPLGDTPSADTNWYVEIPTASAQTITYVADFGLNALGTIHTNAYNESTGFAFNIIPEPSTALLVGAGLFGLLVLRRRLA